MDSAQVKKIEEYVLFLARQAESQEGKDDSQAIQHYVKAADILLALASKAQDQATWERYTRQAEAYQQRAKKRVPSVQGESQKGETSRPQTPVMQESSTRSSKPAEQIPPVASENKSGRFGRLIGAIHPNSVSKQNEPRGSQTVQVQESQRTDSYSISSEAELERRRLAQVAAQQAAPQTSQQVTTLSSASESSESPAEKAVSSHPRSPTPQREARDSSESREVQTTVPYQQYVTLLAENRKLREEMKSMMPVSQYEALEARNRELIETMGLMVPREDYEKLQDRLVEMVPKSMYIDLQRTVTSMVPKEMYLEAEARASSLKAQLDSSVPSKVLDELATRINVLSASAAIQDTSYLEEAPLGFRKKTLGSDEMPEE